MEINELRIGNYVWDNYSGEMIVAGINLNNIFIRKNKNTPSGEIEIKFIKPIPLTEECLIKFGFKQWGTYKHLWKIKNIHGFTIIKESENEYFLNEYPYYRFINNPMKYVHQLQNLYFALTGKELI